MKIKRIVDNELRFKDAQHWYALLSSEQPGRITLLTANKHVAIETRDTHFANCEIIEVEIDA